MYNAEFVDQVKRLIDQVEQEYGVTLAGNQVNRAERLRKLAAIINQLHSVASSVEHLSP